MNPVKGKTMHDLHQTTVEKIQYLKNQGYNVVEIWECAINRELAGDEEMKHVTLINMMKSIPWNPVMLYMEDEPTRQDFTMSALMMKK